MLLAEALAARKDALKRINDLTEALKEAVVVYEDSTNHEDPAPIAKSLLDAAEEFRALTVRINLTNNETTVTFDGRTMSLMEAVAYREYLLLLSRANKGVYERASEKITGGRYGGRRSKEDVRHIEVLPVASFRSAADSASLELRRLDLEIQKRNWVTEVVD